MTPDATKPQVSVVSTLISRIAAMLHHAGGPLTTGDVAALRRMDPRRIEAAFFKLTSLVLDAQLPGDVRGREDLETRWAAIVIGLAHLGDLHGTTPRLGVALANSGFSELRFSRLLRADADRLVDELPMVARYLAAKTSPADWTHAADLILSAGRTDEERVRRNVARDYYGALAKRTEV
jgi:CRISPR system Cascade subunit CasB